ncbi:Mediator of RNA polymerase II transcription subunit 31 [Strongyloides ratti]|uniref:Mediator of RNA polymerase II transcription subunit 31 n=1 Tax=Strongyloides ratti TaxID=34506 RepID=A0A090LI49_STRRB|nr:Mediator of RNA polymerase II transcription subunit 31 [Strongyloides ratti]CEF69491.1 Mediator of RNA polymerase II transcription subunit 31 [Strongyloides ratti]
MDPTFRHVSGPDYVDSERRRFEAECEFVQALGNPHYCNFLAQKGYFKEEYFINYLKYLQYFKQSEYAKTIVYPHCLFMLDCLQHKEFREAIGNVNNAKYIENQQMLQWQYYYRKRNEYNAKIVQAKEAGELKTTEDVVNLLKELANPEKVKESGDEENIEKSSIEVDQNLLAEDETATQKEIMRLLKEVRDGMKISEDGSILVEEESDDDGSEELTSEIKELLEEIERETNDSLQKAFSEEEDAEIEEYDQDLKQAPYSQNEDYETYTREQEVKRIEAAFDQVAEYGELTEEELTKNGYPIDVLYDSNIISLAIRSKDSCANDQKSRKYY